MCMFKIVCVCRVFDGSVTGGKRRGGGEIESEGVGEKVWLWVSNLNVWMGLFTFTNIYLPGTVC